MGAEGIHLHSDAELGLPKAFFVRGQVFGGAVSVDDDSKNLPDKHGQRAISAFGSHPGTGTLLPVIDNSLRLLKRCHNVRRRMAFLPVNGWRIHVIK